MEKEEMTKEEAIARIKALKSLHKKNIPYKDCLSATFDLAIKALEQQPEQFDEIPKEYIYATETKDFLIYRHRYTGDEIHLAKPIPVQAVEQKPCDEAISRQAVISAIMGEYQDAHYPSYYKSKIDELPSVTPQPKIGHWIGHRDHCESLGLIPSGLGAYNWCSNCDCPIDVEEYHRIHYNFCPNCGHQMKDEEE